MTTFSQAVKKEQESRMTMTENGMPVWETTNSSLVDLFGIIGNARHVDISAEFTKAFIDDQDKAIRILLWARDARSGSGERNVFRRTIPLIEKTHPGVAFRLIAKVPELGRWDDLMFFEDCYNREIAIKTFANAIKDGNALAAKWAPRVKAWSRIKTDLASRKNKFAIDMAKWMNLTSREYNKLLTKTASTAETYMSAKEWNKIEYSHVPSVAAARYQNAFRKNDGDRYSAYIRELQKPVEERDPKAKINAGAVYPYDVIKSLMYGGAIGAADAQWEALPDYVGNNKILPMVDVSGSMGVPLAGNVNAMTVALSLGLYLSSKTSSDFKDMFMTFTDVPRIETMKGTLSQKLSQMKGAVGYNTNIAAAFEEMLNVAVKNNVSQENMPDVLLILSDMQFDAWRGTDKTHLEAARNEFRKAGYQVPTIIYWNLAARESARGTHVKADDRNVAFVSGFSPAIMKSILGTDPKDFTPESVMLNTIMVDRYDWQSNE